MMKKFLILVLAAFFAAGAGLWFWVTFTVSTTELKGAALQFALASTTLSFLLIEQTRRRHPGQQ
jgi:hypothetical protein